MGTKIRWIHDHTGMTFGQVGLSFPPHIKCGINHGGNPVKDT